MLFHTSTFAVFFATLLPLYAVFRAFGRTPLLLLLFSQVFYAFWDWRFLILLWITILLDYAIGLRIAATNVAWKRKALLTTSVIISLSILGFFKYWNFLIDSVSLALPSPLPVHIIGLILPVGISFYTFQSMGYVFDVYRGKEAPVRNLINYATFVCYFPHMVAGPIMRIGRLLPSIVRPQPMTLDRTVSGLILFAYGFASKSVGDLLASMHDPVLRDVASASPSTVVFAIVSFGFQIYFDFNGYTEMARGVSRILGIELMRNFRAPYTSTSFREFWQRWHISLSEWLRDYLYISLGGNRVRFPLRLRNLMLTMLLGGLWHGAGWNFVIWGALQGVYLSVNTVIDTYAGSLIARAPFKLLRNIVTWCVTFVGVMYAWLYFRLPSLDAAITANKQIVRWLRAPNVPPIAWGAVVLVILLLAIDVWRRNRADVVPILELTPRRAAAYGLLAGAAAIIGVVLLVGVPTQQFIYFQF